MENTWIPSLSQPSRSPFIFLSFTEKPEPTLGIYSAWAKVRVLKFMYGSTDLKGARFDFHGEPIPILKGRIIAAVLGLLYLYGSKIHIAVGILGLLLIYVGVPWLIVKSLKFRLGYTSYRNIRFSFRGAIPEAYNMWLKFATFPAIIIAINLIALYLYPLEENKADPLKPLQAPIFKFILVTSAIYLIYLLAFFPKFYAKVLTYIYSNIYYGGSRFHFVAESKEIFHRMLLKPFIGLVLGSAAVAIIGFIAFFLSTTLNAKLIMTGYTVVAMFAAYFLFAAVWLAAVYYIIDYIWNRVRLGDAQTKSTIELKRFIFIAISNAVCVALTLGLLYPWAKMRYQRYIINHRGIDIQDFDQFTADSQAKLSAIGEEITSAFDLDIEVGL